MSEQGVFAVDRGVWEHPAFAREPFTQREAWMWLISEAAYKVRSKRADGKVIELARGQLCHSVRFMAEAWQWSKSRVDRFLDMLENRDMLRSDHGTRTPVITICNYDEYQRVSLPDRDKSGTSSGTTPGQERDKLEYRENIKPVVADATTVRSPRRHADWPEDFGERLWAIYPRRTGKKAGLEKLAAIYRSDRVPWSAIVAGVEAMANCDPQFVPELARWLKNERWKDERPAAKPQTGPPQRKTFGQMARDAAAEIAGGYDDQGAFHADHHNGPSLDLVGSSPGSDFFDLHPSSAGGIRL